MIKNLLSISVFLMGINAFAADTSLPAREMAKNASKCDAYWGPKIKEVEPALQKILQRRGDQKFNRDLNETAEALKSRLIWLNKALDYCYNIGLQKSKDIYFWVY
jgi:hypothetical protein